MAASTSGSPAPAGQFETTLEPQRLRHHVEELADRGQAEEGEHALHFVVGVRDVGAHGYSSIGMRSGVGCLNERVPSDELRRRSRR